MFEKIRDIICEQLGMEADEITEMSEFGLDLGCDSLEIIEMMIAVESEFGLDDIPEEDIAEFKTVGDLVAYVTEKTAE